MDSCTQAKELKLEMPHHGMMTASKSVLGKACLHIVPYAFLPHNKSESVSCTTRNFQTNSVERIGI